MKTSHNRRQATAPTVEEYEASGDLGLRARGSDLPAALVSAVHGLVAALVPPETVQAAESRVINVQGKDDEEALVNFLNEVLFLIYGRRWMPKTLEQMKIQPGYRFSGRLVGEPMDPSRHHIEREIKAVTYHNLSITKDQGGVTIDFLCDL